MDGRALLASNLRRLRKERGISQEDLAGAAPVDRTYLSQIERGLGNASVDKLEMMATALQVPIAELFREPHAPSKKTTRKLEKR